VALSLSVTAVQEMVVSCRQIADNSHSLYQTLHSGRDRRATAGAEPLHFYEALFFAALYLGRGHQPNHFSIYYRELLATVCAIAE
jgi:hypothetical protein